MKSESDSDDGLDVCRGIVHGFAVELVAVAIILMVMILYQNFAMP